MNNAKFNVNDIVVLFSIGHPVFHNSPEIATLGGNGCRGRVTKIGKKFYHISTIGVDFKVRIDGNSNTSIHSVDEARRLHTLNFTKNNDRRSAAEIATIVNEF